MKKLIFILFIASTSIVFAQDTTATPYGNFYSDSLVTGTRDTIDVVTSSMSDIDYFQITAYSSAADTLTVWALNPVGTLFVQRGIINLASGASAASMITSTTIVDFIVNGSASESKFRFMSPGSTNAIYFTIAGKKGIPSY